MVIVPFYAGLLALWFVVLSFKVIGFRRKGASLGDGGDPLMLRAIRGHANFAEYVPLALVLLGFLEVSHYSTLLLHALGITLVVARLLHGYALSYTEKFMPGRAGGTVLTFVVLLVSGVLCIYQGVIGLQVQ
ncbi:MAG: MAPEG family protein [Nevskia sp.]